MNPHLKSPSVLVREYLKSLTPFRLWEGVSGGGGIRLNANENGLGSPLPRWYNRYPDPDAVKLKEKLAQIKRVKPGQIHLAADIFGCTDLLMRCFCEPGQDNVVVCTPNDGFPQHAARVKQVSVRETRLDADFQPDVAAIEAASDGHTKLLFLCNPNGISGQSLRHENVEWLLNNFPGIVVLDERYIHFSRRKSWLASIDDYPNLIILQTLSTAWGLAGLSVGFIIAHPEIIRYLTVVALPFSINSPAQALALQALDEVESVNEVTREIVAMREAMAEVIGDIPGVEQVFPSEGNFLLVKMRNADGFCDFLNGRSIFVRNCSNVEGLKDCLRITIGNERENTVLIDAWIDWNDQQYASPAKSGV